jgi:hypothetical protein
MSILSEKYGIPEEKIKLLIKDGWISCSVPQYEEVIVYYKSEISKGVPARQAIVNTSEKTGMSDRNVYYIIHKFK